MRSRTGGTVTCARARAHSRSSSRLRVSLSVFLLFFVSVCVCVVSPVSPFCSLASLLAVHRLQEHALPREAA
eukprot:1440752-Rhodomonas_salina.1